MHKNRLLQTLAIFLLFHSLLLGACTNINPTTPQPSQNPPSAQLNSPNDYVVTYNYGSTGPVQLTANDIVLKVGQKLVLQPAAGVTQNTRFTSSGQYFFGDIMQQQGDPQASGKAVFLATKPGKGKLTIIPNTDETARAVDLWVTVHQ